MTRIFGPMLAALGAAALLVGSAGIGRSAPPVALDQELAGAWHLTQDTARSDGLGPKSAGTVIFAGGGFALQIVRSDMPRFASDDRRDAAPAESQASGKGSLAYFGTYTASDADHSLVLHVNRGSFPNWNGTDQKWTVTVTPDKLTLSDPQDSSVTLVWARGAVASEGAFGTRGGRRVVRF